MKKLIVDHRFYTAPSKIDGTGLFTKETIQADEPLFIAFARKGVYTSSALSELAAKKEKFENHFVQLYPNNFVNHSEQANTVNYWVNDFYIFKKTNRVIQPGEEITSDYQAGMDLISSKGFEVDQWLWFKWIKEKP